jgi:peptide deformylase
MILKIIKWPNTTLKTPSKILLEAPNPSLITDMFETMRNAGGVGLAAIQVGFAQRLFVAQVGQISRVFVNPTWVRQKDSSTVPTLEGCLSVPGIAEIIERYPFITATFQDENLTHKTENLEGLWAQIYQHETQHVNGKFFLDDVTSARRDAIRAALRKNR